MPTGRAVVNRSIEELAALATAAIAAGCFDEAEDLLEAIVMIQEQQRVEALRSKESRARFYRAALLWPGESAWAALWRCKSDGGFMQLVKLDFETFLYLHSHLDPVEVEHRRLDELPGLGR